MTGMKFISSAFPATVMWTAKDLKVTIGGADIVEGSLDGGQIKMKTSDGDKTVALKDVLADCCMTCRFNNPIISDVMIGSAGSGDESRRGIR